MGCLTTQLECMKDCKDGPRTLREARSLFGPSQALTEVRNPTEVGERFIALRCARTCVFEQSSLSGSDSLLRARLLLTSPAEYAHECRTIANLMSSTKRFIICAGGSLEVSDQSAIKTLARRCAPSLRQPISLLCGSESTAEELVCRHRLQCPLVPDILSGLRFGPCDFPRVSYMDLLLLSEKLRAHFFGEEFVVLQFGKSVGDGPLFGIMSFLLLCTILSCCRENSALMASILHLHDPPALPVPIEANI